MQPNDAVIKFKRAYEKADKSDGIRFLADRLWPRGMKKSELQYEQWIKDLCPSTTLRKAWHSKDLSYSQFSKRYSEELVIQQQSLDCIAAIAKKETITLVSAVKTLEKSHLPILKKHLLQALKDSDSEVLNERSSPVCYQYLDFQ